ncbi:hypothetical protein HID58_002805 [Brassica napus]|uniref:Uncharacterized protein n=1 Tax=Brassica napus TaxID=3708 RepID=A0ABQ8ENB6_BRANA|nr:hypothetical protein HID58_002805 [Brassica napus]
MSHEFSGLTIIWASISLQEHPKILQKLEVLMRHFGYILSKAFREAKRDGQMNDGFSYASFEAVGYDFNTIELSQLVRRVPFFDSKSSL